MNGSSAAAAPLRAQPPCSPRPGRSSVPPSFAVCSSAPRAGPGASVASEGAGLVAPGAAAAAELIADQTTLALGNARAAGWKRSHNIFVRNVSTRPLRVRVRFEPYAQGAAPVKFRAFPPRFTIPIGKTKRVRIVSSIKLAPVGDAPAEGSVVLAPFAGAPLRLPWAVTFAPAPSRSSARCTSRRIRSLRRTPVRAADVPCRTARHPGGTRLRPADCAAHARPAERRRRRAGHARNVARPAARPVRVRPHRAHTRGQHARQRPLPNPCHRDPESRRSSGARPGGVHDQIGTYTRLAPVPRERERRGGYTGSRLASSREPV